MNSSTGYSTLVDVKKKGGIFVAITIGIHRISKGYHSVFDVFIGYILGFLIGFISWTVMEYYKRQYYDICKKSANDVNCQNYVQDKGKNFYNSFWFKHFKLFKYELNGGKFINTTFGIARLILSIPIAFLLFRFFSKDLWKLASVTH